MGQKGGRKREEGSNLWAHFMHLKPITCRFGIFLFNHILHCICFTILNSLQNQSFFYLICNWSYTRSIRTIQNMKKLNTKFKIFRVIIIVRNHYFVILKLFRVIKDFILYQIKQMALKSGYNFTIYGKFMDTSWIKEMQTRKPLSPIWTSISRKRQATDLEPWRHKCDTGVQNSSNVSFWLFYSATLYISSATKYFLQNQNLLLTDSTLAWSV